MSAIRIDGVVVQRRGFELGPATESVEAGEVVALVGPNGSGKSTLIGACLGLVPARAGSVEINGRPVDRKHPPQATGAFLSVSGLLGWCDALTNLRLVLDEPAADDAQLAKSLAAVGLAGVGGKPVSAYSTGMRTRLCVARALVGDPKVLILDEPTGGLDVAGVEWLASTLRGAAEAGSTVLVATHDEGFVAGVQARIVAVAHGQLTVGQAS